jgi:hypothetical protein
VTEIMYQLLLAESILRVSANDCKDLLLELSSPASVARAVSWKDSLAHFRSEAS